MVCGRGWRRQRDLDAEAVGLEDGILDEAVDARLLKRKEVVEAKPAGGGGERRIVEATALPCATRRALGPNAGKGRDLSHGNTCPFPSLAHGTGNTEVSPCSLPSGPLKPTGFAGWL